MYRHKHPIYKTFSIFRHPCNNVNKTSKMEEAGERFCPFIYEAMSKLCSGPPGIHVLVTVPIATVRPPSGGAVS